MSDSVQPHKQQPSRLSLVRVDEKLCMYWSLIGQQEAAAAAKSLQSCLTLCDPIDGSPPGSPVPEHWSGLPFPSPVQESEK